MKKCDAGGTGGVRIATPVTSVTGVAMTCFWGCGALSVGGVEPRPYVWQDDFYINVIPRSEATWESVFPYDRGRCGGGLRIATPVCAPVRNDRFFWGAVQTGRRGRRPLRSRQKSRRAGPVCPAAGGAEHVGRRHTWVPPYRNAIKKSERTG